MNQIQNAPSLCHNYASIWYYEVIVLHNSGSIPVVMQ